MAVYRLKNSIQHYPWGSKSLLPDLLGIENPEGVPYAELWMGAHPKAPSQVLTEGGAVPLDRLVESDPAGVIGTRARDRFGRLPFLFKFLAAGEPLSIQAHPTKAQAEAGWERENREGIDPGAPERNYRDDNHKPEVVAALTPFWALRGFRTPEEILRLAEELGCDEYLTLARIAVDRGLEEFFRALMRSADPGALIASILAAAAEREGDTWRWLERLDRVHPGDIGVAAPLYLNLIRLEPGEGLYLDAGELHAYLEGLAVELMANSDNVLRGGLTVKHVDVDELLEVLSFDGGKPAVLRARSGAGGEAAFDTPSAEFRLSRLEPVPGKSLSTGGDGECRILACAAGEIMVEEAFRLAPGESLFVTADHGAVGIGGEGTLYAAAVPG